MSFAILALVAASAPVAAGEQASAQAAVEILKPVIVRQGSGPAASPDLPQYQVTRREGAVLVEFQ